MLMRRRLAIAPKVQGLVSHMLRKTVASFLDDADVSTRKIGDQFGHSKVSMTEDRYLGRKLTDRQTADVLEKIMGESGEDEAKMSCDLGCSILADRLPGQDGAPPGTRTPNPLIKSRKLTIQGSTT
jgi:hypothetical protein